VDALVGELGRPQVLINSAGTGKFANSHEMPFEDWSRIIAVNLTGTFLMAQAVLPQLMLGGGNIVNVASNAGLMGAPYSAAYCASKGGVVNLTRAPLGMAEPEEVATLIAYVASDEARYMTGSIVSIDGGITT